MILKQHCKQHYKTVVPWDSFLLAEEYNLAKEVFVQASFTDPKMSSSGLQCPKLTWSMKVTRSYEFHLYLSSGPCSSSWSSRCPCRSCRCRRSAAVGALPDVAPFGRIELLRDHAEGLGLTRLDQYVLLCQLLIACSAIESALVFFAIKRQWNMGLSEETVEEIEDRVIVLLGVVWVVPHAFAARFMEASAATPHGARARGEQASTAVRTRTLTRTGGTWTWTRPRASAVLTAAAVAVRIRPHIPAKRRRKRRRQSRGRCAWSESWCGSAPRHTSSPSPLYLL